MLYKWLKIKLGLLMTCNKEITHNWFLSLKIQQSLSQKKLKLLQEASCQTSISSQICYVIALSLNPNEDCWNFKQMKQVFLTLILYGTMFYFQILFLVSVY